MRVSWFSIDAVWVSEGGALINQGGNEVRSKCVCVYAFAHLAGCAIRADLLPFCYQPRSCGCVIIMPWDSETTRSTKFAFLRACFSFTSVLDHYQCPCLLPKTWICDLNQDTFCNIFGDVTLISSLHSTLLSMVPQALRDLKRKYYPSTQDKESLHSCQSCPLSCWCPLTPNLHQ